MSQHSPLRLGIAGLGTVGTGVVKIVRQQAALLSARAGREVVITAVSARDQSRDRGVSLSGYAWETDPVALAKRDDVDVFVELMGGEDGPAKDAGIQAEDVIISFDGVDVSDTRSLVRQVGATEVGKTVRVVVVRNGKEETLKTCMQSTPQKEDRNEYGDENEAPVDSAALFLKTPGNKSSYNLVEGLLGNSCIKLSVSPFFHNK